MRRILSWLTLFAAFIVENLALILTTAATSWVIGQMYGLNAIFRWMIILIGGTTFLGVIFGVSFYGAIFSCKLSQSVWRSKKGVRYIVMGGFYAVYYVYMLIMHISHHTGFNNVLLSILMLIYFACVIFNGMAMSSEDGAPPTKREILQAKIDKIDAKNK